MRQKYVLTRLKMQNVVLRDAGFWGVLRKAMWLKFHILCSKIPKECSLRVVSV